MSDDRAPDPSATSDDLLPDDSAADEQPDREVEPPAEDVAAADAAALQADDPVYAANAPASEAVAQAEQVEDGAAVPPSGSVATDQQGVDDDLDDPPNGTEQPVAEDADGLDDEDGWDDGATPAGEVDGIEELSADVRALDDDAPESAGAFDDSSSVVESDQTDTGVVDDAADGGDEHARDRAVRDLDDDHDGIESPQR